MRTCKRCRLTIGMIRRMAKNLKFHNLTIDKDTYFEIYTFKNNRPDAWSYMSAAYFGLCAIKRKNNSYSNACSIFFIELFCFFTNFICWLNAFLFHLKKIWTTKTIIYESF